MKLSDARRIEAGRGRDTTASMRFRTVIALSAVSPPAVYLLQRPTGVIGVMDVVAAS